MFIGHGSTCGKSSGGAGAPNKLNPESAAVLGNSLFWAGDKWQIIRPGGDGANSGLPHISALYPPQVAQIIKREMENAVPLSVTLKVKVKFGPSWGDLQDFDL